jgi:hypothetical protein
MRIRIKQLSLMLKKVKKSFIFGPANPEQHPDPEQPLATEC